MSRTWGEASKAQCWCQWRSRQDKATRGCQCPPFGLGTGLFEPSLGAFLPREMWLLLLESPSPSDGSTVHEEPEPQIQEGTRWTNPGTPPVPGTADGSRFTSSAPRAAPKPREVTGNVFTGCSGSLPPSPWRFHQLCFARGKQPQFGPFMLCWSLNPPMLQPWLCL